MKKISLIALAVCTSAAVFAQDQPRLKTDMARRTYFGITAGVNSFEFNVENNNSLKTNNKTSFHGGVMASIPLGAGALSFNPALIYNSIGSKLSMAASGTTPAMNWEQDLNYLSVPLLLQIKPGKGFFFEVGPQASFLLSAKQKVTNGGETDNKANFDKFDLAILGGLGYTTRVGVGVHARYNYGVTNIFEESGTTNPGKANNRGYQFGLHYLFGANQ